MANSLTSMLKRAGIVVLDRIGPLLGVLSLQTRLCMWMYPYLLDEAVLPRGFVPRRLRGCHARILCDPYTYSHVIPYWCRRLYNGALESYLRRHLKRGDTVIDVGANLGHITVLSASLIRPEGCVHAFEANPVPAALVEKHCLREGLGNVKVHHCALGDVTATRSMRVDQHDLGGGTLRDSNQGGECNAGVHVIPVEVRRGDDELAGEPLGGRVFLKVDVEGFEIPVLAGLGRTLSERVDHAIVEVTPDWIGGEPGVAKLFSIMEGHGFEPRELRGRGCAGRSLVPADIRTQTDVLFLRRK